MAQHLRNIGRCALRSALLVSGCRAGELQLWSGPQLLRRTQARATPATTSELLHARTHSHARIHIYVSMCVWDVSVYANDVNIHILHTQTIEA